MVDNKTKELAILSKDAYTKEGTYLDDFTNDKDVVNKIKDIYSTEENIYSRIKTIDVDKQDKGKLHEYNTAGFKANVYLVRWQRAG